jgi:hypothetical protein
MMEEDDLLEMLKANMREDFGAVLEPDDPKSAQALYFTYRCHDEPDEEKLARLWLLESLAEKNRWIRVWLCAKKMIGASR